MAALFISYARSTVAATERIVQALRAAGHTVWRDDQLPAHRPYAEVIEERLETAKAVIVVWSADAARSEWVQAEAERGRTARKLVQLRIDDVRLPMPFDRIECADLRDWNGRPGAAGMVKVLASIDELLQDLPRAPEAAALPFQARRSSAWWSRTPWAAVSALALLTVVYAAWSLRPAHAPGSMSVELAALTPIGADVPTFVPAAMDQALRDDFGRDNAVVVKSKDADYVLRGTVERIGAKLHYSMRLEAIDDGAALWTTTRERPADSPIGVMRVAAAATWVVRCGLSRAAEYPGRLPAHTLGLYLTFCDTWSGAGTLRHAIDLARAVVAEAPRFSRGWSGLALSEAQSAWSATAGDASALRAQATKDAAQALRLDRRNPEAYVAQADLVDGRLAERDAAFQRALAARPSDCGCEAEGYGDFLASTGRFTEANRQTEHALDLMPQNPGALRQLYEGYLRANEPARADDIFSRVSAQFLPDDATPLEMRHVRALWAGDWVQAGATLPPRASPELRAALFEAYAALSGGDPQRIALAATRVAPMIGGRDAGSEITEVLAALGARDAALSALEAEIDRNEGLAPASLFDPPLERLRNDARYVGVLHRSGLTDYWRATRSRPDACRAATAPQWCRSLG